MNHLNLKYLMCLQFHLNLMFLMNHHYPKNLKFHLYRMLLQCMMFR